MIQHTAVGSGWWQASSCSTLAAVATWNQPFDFIGVPAAVIFMAFAGAAAGLIAQPPQAAAQPPQGRGGMLLLTLAYTFVSAVVTVVLGEVPHLEFLKTVDAPLAGLLAFFAQVLIPALRVRVQREVQNRGAPNGNDGGSP